MGKTHVIKLPKTPKKGISKNLPPEMYRRLLKSARRTKKECEAHFRKRALGGWDLYFDLLRANITRDALGTDMTLVIMGLLTSDKYDYRVKNGEIMLTKAKRKKK